MLQATYKPYKLIFRTPGGTSRGVLTEKTSWFITLRDESRPNISGIGECSVLPALSPDDHPMLETKIKEVCENIHSLVPEFLKFQNFAKNTPRKKNHISEPQNINAPFKPNASLIDQLSKASFHKTLAQWPAIRFAIETAMIDLVNGGEKELFPSPFTDGEAGIPINGLIWMGTPEEMLRQIEEKLDAGFRCLKMKIGAIAFEAEYKILKRLRKEFPKDELELRVDANGAFSPAQAPRILEQLAKLDIHSIEQPIAAGQWEKMAALCEASPLPVALDEELIAITCPAEKEKLLSTIHPQFIILKPSLTGGFLTSQQWIDVAREYNTGWWVTSALESNIGLNAIAQWTFILNSSMPQGLGTGQVFTNNIKSPLKIKDGQLWLKKQVSYDI